MTYAKIENGSIVKWPCSKREFDADRRSAGLPSASLDWYDAASLAEYGIVPVIDEPEPGNLAPGEYTSLADPEMIDGVCTRPRIVVPVTAERLAAHEADLHAQIDREAGAFRIRFITDVPGQAQTYEQKAKEAEIFAGEADPDNPTASYPMLEAEAQATGAAVKDVAAIVSATRAAWIILGAAIEGARMGAKKAVTIAKSAGDWAAMDAAAQVDWEGLIP